MPKKSADQTFLESLKAQRDGLLAELHRIDALIVGVEQHVKGATKLKPSSTARPNKTQKRAVNALLNPIAAMPLPEAAAHQLASMKRPQLTKDLWASMKRAGVSITAKDPPHAVLTALHRRAKVVGDVVLIGNGYWGMRNWYTADELAEQKKKLGGMGGRDREEHVRRTKEGIKKLLDRGGRYGAVLKITPEVIDRLRAHMADGCTAKEASAKEGISTQSFFLLRRNGVQGLDRLSKEERRRIRRKRAEAEQPVPDLLTPHNDGSVH